MLQPDQPDAGDIVGCVLAGGRSSRMGGGDKPLLDLGGRPILGHVLARLRPQVGSILVNANGDPERFEAFGVPVVGDQVADFAGPLAGILAGLRWAQSSAPTATHVLTVSGDAPFFPDDLGARLSAAVAASPGAMAIASSAGQLHPVFGLWPVAAADGLERDIKAGHRAVHAWCEQRGTLAVDFPLAMLGGRKVDPFINANTPLELAELRFIVQRDVYKSPVAGVVGWKNSGKTTLVCRLVAALSARGHRVSTIKFSHHDLTRGAGGDVPDTQRHLKAGAAQVAFAGPERWALLNIEGSPLDWNGVGDDRETLLRDVVARMAPADLIIVEGYKTAAVPKIEVRRAAQPDRRWLDDPQHFIFAAVSDAPSGDIGPDVRGRWLTHLDDVGGIADQLKRLAGLRPRAP